MGDNDYTIFFNGFTWTCEVSDEEGAIIETSVGDTPVEALKNALKLLE